MNQKKNFLLLICMCCCLSVYAAAGFADAFNDRQHWIYPAYLYNLIFGVVAIVCLWTTTLIFKQKCKLIVENISTYFRFHPILAIVSMGILLSIPFGLCMSLLWEIFWFLAIIPSFGIIILYPCILANKRIRKKWILSPRVLKWLILFVLACIVSSGLFIMLTNAGVLPNTDITYLARPSRMHPDFYSPTHPYDSLAEIWGMVPFLCAESIIALGLLGLGKVNDYLRKRLSAIRQRKRATFSEL